jgi:hypothetical protein
MHTYTEALEVSRMAPLHNSLKFYAFLSLPYSYPVAIWLG